MEKAGTAIFGRLIQQNKLKNVKLEILKMISCRLAQRVIEAFIFHAEC